MTRNQVEKIVSRVQYRPGWRFAVDPSGDVIVTARVRDARGSGKTLTVNAWVMDPTNGFDESGLIDHIHRAVMNIHYHEAAEWFRYGGKRIYDPHR